MLADEKHKGSDYSIRNIICNLIYMDYLISASGLFYLIELIKEYMTMRLFLKWIDKQELNITLNSTSGKPWAYEKYLLNKVVIFHPWLRFNFMCHREGNTKQVFLGDNLQKLHEKDIELHHILLTMQEGNEKKKRKWSKEGRKPKWNFHFCYCTQFLFTTHLEVRYGKKMFK